MHCLPLSTLSIWSLSPSVHCLPLSSVSICTKGLFNSVGRSRSSCAAVKEIRCVSHLNMFSSLVPFMQRHLLLRLNIAKNRGEGTCCLIFIRKSNYRLQKKRVTCVKIFEQRTKVIGSCYQKAFCILQKLRSRACDVDIKWDSKR